MQHKVLEAMYVLLPFFSTYFRYLPFSFQYMLRQGKSAVQALHEVEVLTTDYVGEETPMNTDSHHQSTFSPMSVHTLVRGWLHVRTGNIGMSQSNRRPWLQWTADSNNFLSSDKISAIHGPLA